MTDFSSSGAPTSTGAGDPDAKAQENLAKKFAREDIVKQDKIIAALKLWLDSEGKRHKEILSFLSKQDRGLTHSSKLEEQDHYAQGVMMNIMKRAELREQAKGKPHIPNIARILTGGGTGGSVVGGLGRIQSKMESPFGKAWEFQKKQKQFEKDFNTKLNIPVQGPGLRKTDIGDDATRKKREELLEEQKKIFSPLLKGKLGKIIGGLGKTMESPLGQAGGAAGGLIIGVMTKAIKMGIEASPMMQAMLKITQTAMMLFLRPIGDFIGGMLRPIALFFMREVAIPMLRAGKGMMSLGTQVGKGILGFVLKPIESMQKMLTIWADQIGLTAWVGGTANVEKWQRYDAMADWKTDKKIEAMLAIINSVMPEDEKQMTRAELEAYNAAKKLGIDPKNLDQYVGMDELRRGSQFGLGMGVGMTAEEQKKAWSDLVLTIEGIYPGETDIGARFENLQIALDEKFGAGTQYAGALEHGSTLADIDARFEYTTELDTELKRFGALLKNFNDTNEGLLVAVDAAGNPIDPKILDTQTDVDTADAAAAAAVAYQKIAQVHFMTGGYEAWKGAGGGRQVGEGIEGWGEEGTMVRDWQGNLVSKSHLINNAERRAMAAEEQGFRKSRETWMGDRLSGARAGFDANDRSSFGGSSYFGTAGFAKIWMAATGGNALGPGGMNLSESQQDAEKLRWLMEMQKREGGLGEMGGIYKQLADIGLTPAEFLNQTTARAQPTTAQNEAAKEFTRVTVEGTEAMDELKDSVEGTIAPQELNTIGLNENTVAVNANTTALNNLPDPQKIPSSQAMGTGFGIVGSEEYVYNPNPNAAPPDSWNPGGSNIRQSSVSWAGGTTFEGPLSQEARKYYSDLGVPVTTSGDQLWMTSGGGTTGTNPNTNPDGSSTFGYSSSHWSNSQSGALGRAISASKRANPGAWGRALSGKAMGGWITEPIFGVGQSGQGYAFGETGPEYITPAGKMDGGGIVANISINIEKIAHDIDLEQIKPIVERALLEVHARRGII